VLLTLAAPVVFRRQTTSKHVSKHCALRALQNTKDNYLSDFTAATLAIGTTFSKITLKSIQPHKLSHIYTVQHSRSK